MVGAWQLYSEFSELCVLPPGIHRGHTSSEGWNGGWEPEQLLQDKSLSWVSEQEQALARQGCEEAEAGSPAEKGIKTGEDAHLETIG